MPRSDPVDPDALAEALAEWSYSYESLEPVLDAARAFLEAPTADRLRAVIEDEGPNPHYHRKVMERHREEWPTLWAAIDEILEMGRVRLVAERSA